MVRASFTIQSLLDAIMRCGLKSDVAITIETLGSCVKGSDGIHVVMSMDFRNLLRLFA